MAQITYANKEALNENPEIADINKVKATDMNEIKQVVNDNYNLEIQFGTTQPTDTTCKFWYKTDTNEMYLRINNAWQLIDLGTLANVPVGTIFAYAGTTAPDGYMICNGTAISRTTYSTLFGIFGTTYGVGDGSTTFNIPDLRGNVPVGYKEDDDTFGTLGNSVGSKYLQEHNHLIVDSSSKYVMYYKGDGSGNINATIGGNNLMGGSNAEYTGNSGTGNAGNVQPSLIINYIIKVAQTTPTLSTIEDSYGTSTTNGYSQNYINGINKFSTSEEIDTGEVWIDNKKIYKKTLQLEASTTTQSISVSSIANNIDSIWIDMSNSFYGEGGIISDWQVTGGRYRIVIDSGSVYYVCSDLLYKDGTITFKYTKNASQNRNIPNEEENNKKGNEEEQVEESIEDNKGDKEEKK